MLCYFQNLRNLCWHWAGLSIAYTHIMAKLEQWYQWIGLYLAIGFFYFFILISWIFFKGVQSCNAPSAKIYIITNDLGGNAAFLADFFIGLAELHLKNKNKKPIAMNVLTPAYPLIPLSGRSNPAGWSL